MSGLSRAGLRMLCGMALALVVSGGGTAAAAPPTGWTSQPPLNVARVGAAYATVGGRPMVVGGFSFTMGGLDSVEVRSAAGAWQFAAPMPTSRVNAVAAVLGGRVWVLGGYHNGAAAPIDVVEIYNPQTGSWSTGPALPVGRAQAGAAVLDGVLYVAGGYLAVGKKKEAVTASVLAYDPRVGEWAPVSSLPSARGRVRLAAVGDHLYAIGGQNTDGDTVALVDRYNPGTGTWQAVAPMVEDRAVPGVTVLGSGRASRIAVIGGCQYTGYALVQFRRTTEVYDPTTDQWRLLPAQLPTGRCSLSAAEYDGALLAIGGGADTAPGGEPTVAVDALRLPAAG